MQHSDVNLLYEIFPQCSSSACNLFRLFCVAAGPKDTPMDLVLQKTYNAKTGVGMPDL